MSVFKPKYRDKETGELRESAVWHYEFIFAGKRIRQSAKTPKKTLALRAEQAHRERLAKAYAGQPSEQPKARIRTVAECLQAYLSSFALGHRPKSVETARERAAHVKRILGPSLLPDLTEDRIRKYMEQRLGESASNRATNLEVDTLARSIGQSWGRLWPSVARLTENSDVGRALDAEEEQRILDAARHSRSPLIHAFLMVLAWTGLRKGEARLLRWEQIDFETGEIVVGKSKTRAGRGRRVPMSSTLLAVMEQHASWYANLFGPLQPGWFVFPRSRRVKAIDATQPIGSLQRAWSLIQKASGVRCRLHDLRHSFISKLGAAAVPEFAMLALAGHCSKQMLQRYCHTHKEARRAAIDAIERGAIFGVAPPQESPKVSKATDKGKPVTH